ncbi:MAG TPA: hypothetical protein VHE78_17735 [Gemmatimonadaceae bacterium]|nr:hypothetical protein [Gemmatimonadaceae bacterium]
MRASQCVASIVVLAAGVDFAPSSVRAQDYDFRPRVQWEARADGLLASPAAAQIGVGANVPGGYYMRYGVTAAAGPAWTRQADVATARVDLTARYLLDPFHEIAWGLYGGAGLSSRWDKATNWREYLLVVAGAEGPARRGWRVALEVGLGGGARIGIVLRRARANGR